MNERLEQLLKLHRAEPNDPFCTYGIALEHGKAGQYDQAVQWLDKTLAMDGHYHYAFFQKAKMLSELGDNEAARQVLRAGISAATDGHDEKALGEMEELLSSIE